MCPGSRLRHARPAALLAGAFCAAAQAEPIDVLQNRREYFVELHGHSF